MFPEYEEIVSLSKTWGQFGKVQNLVRVQDSNNNYDLYSFSIGCNNPEAPSLILTSGVHGLERIGTQVNLSFMQHLVARLPWDECLHDQLKKMRITFFPLVN